MLKTLVLVGVGGGVGSMLRYLVSVLTYKYNSGIFPWATFIVNMVGCLLIGLLIGVVERQIPNSISLKYLFITGFCGGFTTFSAFSLEGLLLIQTGNASLSIIYILTSIVLGLLVVWAGIEITNVF